MKKALAIAGLVILALGAGQAASADTIQLNVGAGGVSGDRIIGEIFTTNDIQGGLAVRDAVAINALIDLAPGTRTGTAPQYYRSTTDFGALPDAVTAGAKLTNPGDFTVVDDWLKVVLSTQYVYLMGSYDGPNGGSQLWYIADLAPGTEIYIPFTAEPMGSPKNLVDSSRYRATSWTAFNPTSVPDGGATAGLLSMALSGLAFARRFRR